MGRLNVGTLHKFRDWIKPCTPVYFLLWRAPVGLWHRVLRVRGGRWQCTPESVADACWRGTYWLLFDLLVWRQNWRERAQRASGK